MSDHDVTVWEDDDEGIGFWDKLTPDEQAAIWAHGKDQAAGYLDRIHGDELGKPDAGEGPCADCGHIAPYRWTLAKLELCRRCITSRHGAARRLNEPAPPAKPEPEPEPDTTDPIEKVTFTDVTAVLQARAALAEDLTTPPTNGNKPDDPDDLWAQPDF